jgi:hypothetical protein
VAPGDPTPFGWSPSAAMALLSAPRTVVVRYRDAASDGLVRRPSSASTTIHLQFTVDESRLYFVASSQNGMISPYCNNHMALGGTLTLMSDDGAFNEVIATELIASGPGLLMSDLTIPAKDLRGSFSLATAGARDGDQFTFLLQQTIVDGAWVGVLYANTPAGGRLEYPYADWGSAPCEVGSAPITAEDPVLSSLAVQAAGIIESAVVPIAFSDGTSTMAHLSFPQFPLPCRLVDPQLDMRMTRVLSSAPQSGLYLVGPVAVVTDDRRWVANLPAKAGGTVASGALTTMQLHTDTQVLSPTEFVSYYGFAGVDFGTFDRARLAFTVNYTVDGTQRATGGYFEIMAFLTQHTGWDAGGGGSTVLLTGKVAAP